MYTPLSGPMVYTLFPCFPRKMVYTIAFCWSVTSASGDKPRKEGSHGGGVYSFLPLHNAETAKAVVNDRCEREHRAKLKHCKR